MVSGKWWTLLLQTFWKQRRRMYAIFLNIPGGVTGIADDMIIYGKDDLEHDGNLLNILEVCRKDNLILNAEKMQFRLPQVSFFGHIWTDHWVSHDPKKIKAVWRMELSQEVETMRSFLGLVNYLNQFSPHLAGLSDPLRKIWRQKMDFKLTRACKVVFQWTKEEISRGVTLLYFSPNTSTILKTDASKWGLGVVLLQNSKPVMFASRTLTGSKRNYQNLYRKRVSSHNMGHGKIPLLSLWKGDYLGNGSEATSIYLQEAYGGNFPKDPEIGGEKLPISAFQNTVQKNEWKFHWQMHWVELSHYLWKRMEYS